MSTFILAFVLYCFAASLIYQTILSFLTDGEESIDPADLDAIQSMDFLYSSLWGLTIPITIVLFVTVFIPVRAGKKCFIKYKDWSNKLLDNIEE